MYIRKIGLALLLLLLAWAGAGLARNAVVNPVLWDPAFGDTAFRDTVQYVYFTAAPETGRNSVYTADTIWYRHVLTDSGSANFSIALADSSHHYSAGIQVRLFHDVNNSGVFEAGTDTQVSGTPALAPNGSFSLLIRLAIPDETIPDSTYDTVRIVCTSNTGPAWRDTLLDYSVIRIRTATKVLASLTPNTAIAGAATGFTYRLVPQDGSADQFKIVNPFPASVMQVTGIRINSTVLVADSTATRPMVGDHAAWYYLNAGDTLLVLLNNNRLDLGETLAVNFTETMPFTPVDQDSFISFFTGVDISTTHPCSAATGTEWDLRVVPAAVAYYLVVPDSNVQRAGTRFLVTLIAKDMFGNTCTNVDTAGVTFTWLGPANAPDGTAPLWPSSKAVKDSLVASSWDSVGKARVPVTLYNASLCSLMVVDAPGSAGGRADSLRVTPERADTLWVSAPTTPDSVLAGGNISIYVDVRDQFMNRVLDTTRVTWSWFDIIGVPNDSGGENFSDNPTYYNTAAGRSQVIFTPSSHAGDDYKVVAHVGALRDTTPVIKVITNNLDHIVILYAGGDTVKDTIITTDNDTLRFSAMGYDLANNQVGLQNAVWTMVGDSIGGLNPLTGQSTVLRADCPETARIAASYTAGSTYCDTTGLIIVRVGMLRTLMIAPNETTITADDSLQFTVTGYDADNNITPVVGTLTWGGGAGIGAINSVSGLFTARHTGVDSITVVSSIGGVTDRTGRITVRHGMVTRVELTPWADTLLADNSRNFTFTAFDADSNSWNINDSVGTVWGATGSRQAVAGGVYYADTVGQHFIYASHAGFADTSSIFVQHGAVIRLVVLPDTARVTTDTVLAFAARAYDADNNSWDVTDTSITIWSENDPNVLSADSGHYSPVRPGTFQVWAYYKLLADTGLVMVTHGRLVSLQVVPDDTTITTDQTLSLTATGFDDDGNTWPVTDSTATAWTTTEIGNTIANGVYSPDSVGTFLVQAVNNGQRDSCLVTVTYGAPESLIVTPDTAAITTDNTLSLTATAVDSAGNRWDVTLLAAWNTDDLSVPVSNGQYNPDQPGSYQVFAAYLGLADTCRINVQRGAMARLDVTPATAGIPTDSALHLLATAYDADNNPWAITDSATWTTTDLSVTVTNGVYNPDSTGGYLVMAAWRGFIDTCTVTVWRGAPDSFAVWPATATITTDDTLHLAARAWDREGFMWDVTDSAAATWGTDDAAVTVTAGRYKPVANGTYLVYAHYLGRADTCQVYVGFGAIVRLEMVPADTALTTDDSLFARAYAYDAGNNRWEITDSAVWTTDDASVSVVRGRYRPDSTGTYLMWATKDSMAVACTVTVTHGRIALFDVVPDSAAIPADSTLVLMAWAYDAASMRWNVTDTATWATDEAGVIVDSGRYNPVRTGRHRVWAVYGGFSDTSNVDVTHGATAVQFRVLPDTAVITSDSALGLTAEARDADGNIWNVTLDPATSWATDDTAGAVDAAGNYRPLLSGTFRVWAAYRGQADTCVVTVTHGSVDRIEIFPGDTLVTSDNTIAFRAMAFDRNNTAWDITAQAAWSTDTVGGHITAGGVYDPRRVYPGWPVRAAFSNLADTVWVRVTPGDTNYVRIETGSGRELGDTTVEAGDTLPVFAIAYDADGNYVCDLDAFWGRYNTSDTIAPAQGKDARFRPIHATGAAGCRLTAAFPGVRGDTTGRIIIVAEPEAFTYQVRVNNRAPLMNESVICSLIVFDRFGNRAYNYLTNPRRIDITVRPDTADTMARVIGHARFAGRGVVDGFDNTAYIEVGDTFVAGVALVYIRYDSTENPLQFLFTEQVTGASGLSPSVVWKDPELVSHVEMYPSPFNVARHERLRIEYVLKEDADVSVRIFSLSGEFVLDRSFAKGAPGGSAGPQEFFWDGTNARGRYVGTGGYIVKMWLNTGRSNLAISRKVGVIGHK
jgi:hypothetical protein